MPGPHAFFKRHALDEYLRLSLIAFYGYLFAAAVIGLATGLAVRAL